MSTATLNSCTCALDAHDAAMPTVHEAIAAIRPEQQVQLAYDGSLEGALACMFVAFSRPGCVTEIAEGAFLQMRLGSSVVAVPTDVDAAQRVFRTICRSLGPAIWQAVVAACASDDPDRANVLYRFLVHALTRSRTAPCRTCPRKDGCASRCSSIPSNRLAHDWGNPHVEPLLSLQRRVDNEAHRMRGFIRFEHLEDGLWFARCNPSCSIVPFVMGHFSRRFNSQRFAIYDEVHHVLGMSEHGRWQLVRTDCVDVGTRAREEDEMQDSWKRFYQALSIDERYHPELRRQFMPMRLWRNITEVRDEAHSL